MMDIDCADISKNELMAVISQPIKPQIKVDKFEPVEQTKQRESLFSLAQGWEGYDQQFSYLIKGYLPANSFGMIYGASGSYKSFHALSWAVHVALGIDWNGCRVESRPVLYIAGEGGVGVSRRLKALAMRYHNGSQLTRLYRIDFGVQVTDASQMNELVKLVQHKAIDVKEQFGLVIIDTLARSFGGADENQAKDMGAFISACDQIRANTGATLLVIHHSGVQDKERARGSSSLRAACDFEYRIERESEPKLAYILKATKSKDEKEQPAQAFELAEHKLFTDHDGDDICSLAALNVGMEPLEAISQDTKPLSANEQALYQAVRSRMASGESTDVALIRDDFKAQGQKGISNFSKWLRGCVEKGVLQQTEDRLVTVIVDSD
ncbi:helicase RepA family protein [Shewanella sp.]|uniref:helicase RepA family protein n=1 Tax=Shewanella sp. TaxID=50422 RepID=UPI004047CF97